MEAFDRVAEAVFNKELTGQKDIEIPTKSAILTCRKAKGTSIVKHPLVAGNAIVKFPDIEDLFGNKAVDVQVKYIDFLNNFSLIPRCMYFESNSSDNVATTPYRR